MPVTTWACDGCPKGRHCVEKCLCYKCQEQKRCPGAEDCLYDDDGKQIREVRQVQQHESKGEPE